MDPSALNSSRMGNSLRALDDWRKGRNKGPFSLWGALIVLLILVGAILFVFHNASPKNNFSVLKSVPQDQVQQLKNTLKKFGYGINFPVELPFTPTQVRTESLNQGIQIDFSDAQNTIEEQITASVTSDSLLRNQSAVSLPNADSVATGMNGNYPELIWNSGHLSYVFVITQWKNVNPPSAAQLIDLYKHMTTIYP